MTGIELRNETLIVDREPNTLDDLAIEFSSLLRDYDIRHVYRRSRPSASGLDPEAVHVAGYVAILAGRARATQDIDVLIEPTDSDVLDELGRALSDRGFWGPAMPLAEMSKMVTSGDNIWVAHDGVMAPHLEVKFASDQFDHASLQHALTAKIGDAKLPIGPLELQIAYKLFLGT